LVCPSFAWTSNSYITCYPFMHGLSPWWWRQYAPLKCRSTARLHGATSQKTLNFMSLLFQQEVRSRCVLSIVNHCKTVFATSIVFSCTVSSFAAYFYCF
jgi:hypothetical protein